jgi:hypothetical protein
MMDPYILIAYVLGINTWQIVSLLVSLIRRR